jgi:tetraacyldisaccharide 4'-kinase
VTAVLFVSNGHGEAAIAKRISRELRELDGPKTDHLALVGRDMGDTDLVDVGPQRTLPSGGLVAMGNVRAFAADVRAGFFGLLLRQAAFLWNARSRYAAVVAVGDVYCLLLAKLVRRPTVFVGTAKSVYVAPYGPLERRILCGAQRIFVRDPATALFLRRRRVPAEAPGNVIVDLLTTRTRVDWGTAKQRIALLPGSRERAYCDAVRLADVARRVARSVPETAAILSVAPGLKGEGFSPALAGDPPIAAWHGDLGALLAQATIAIGQAGTANEAAAACGVPVVALASGHARKPAWYRMRQARLLGDALTVVPHDPQRAAAAVAALLADERRRTHMARVGRERMGEPGGATAIARAIAALTSPLR